MHVRGGPSHPPHKHVLFTKSGAPLTAVAQGRETKQGASPSGRADEDSWQPTPIRGPVKDQSSEGAQSVVASPGDIPSVAQWSSEVRTSRVRFWIQFHAQFGQRMRMVGSHPKLGETASLNLPCAERGVVSTKRSRAIEIRYWL
jgi:hypothetical protein